MKAMHVYHENSAVKKRHFNISKKRDMSCGSLDTSFFMFCDKEIFN